MRSPTFRRDVTATVLTLIIFGAGGFVAWYRAIYYVWPGQGVGARVHWCGRDYQNDDDPLQTWPQISATTSLPIRAVGTYPPLGWSRQQLLAPIGDATPYSCGTVLYLRAGPGKYQTYALLGGP
jgi:hypothetical protein